jgi:hypothetical protein
MNFCKHCIGSSRFRAFREDRILVAEEGSCLTKSKSVTFINVWVGIVENHFVDPFVLPPPHYVQKAPQEIREDIRGILNRMWLSWTRRAEACILNKGRHFAQHLRCFILYFYSQLQPFHFVV